MKKGLVVLNTAIMLTNAFAPVTNALPSIVLEEKDLATLELAEEKQSELENEIKTQGYVLSDSNIYTNSSFYFVDEKIGEETTTNTDETKYLTEEEAKEVAGKLTGSNTEIDEETGITTVTVTTAEVEETEIDVTKNVNYRLMSQKKFSSDFADSLVESEKAKLEKEGFEGTIEKKLVYSETFYDEGETSKETKTNLTKEEADAEKAKEVNNNEKKVVVTVQVNGKKVITVDEKTCSTNFYNTEEEALAAAKDLVNDLEEQGYVEIESAKETKNETRFKKVTKYNVYKGKIECPEGTTLKTVDGKTEISPSKYSEKSEADYENENSAINAGNLKKDILSNNEELTDLAVNSYKVENGTEKVEIDPTIVNKDKVTKAEYDKDVRDNTNNKDVTVSNPVVKAEVSESKIINDNFNSKKAAEDKIKELEEAGYDVSELKVQEGIEYISTSTYKDGVYRLTNGDNVDPKMDGKTFTHLDIQTTSKNITVVENGVVKEKQQGNLVVTEYYVISTVKEGHGPKATEKTVKTEVKFVKGTDPQGYNEYQTYRPLEYTPHKYTAEHNKWGDIKNDIKFDKNSTVEIHFELTVNGQKYNVVYEGHLYQDNNTCTLRENRNNSGYDLVVDNIIIKDGEVVVGLESKNTYTISGTAKKYEDKYSYTITTKNYEDETIYKYGYEINGTKHNFVDTYTCTVPYEDEEPEDYTLVKYNVSSDKITVPAYDVEIETTPKTERVEEGYEVVVKGTKTHKEKRYVVKTTKTVIETQKVEKEKTVYDVEVKGTLPENPKTYDKTEMYATLSFTSFIGMIFAALSLKKKKTTK